MNDTISRQAAYNVLTDYYHHRTEAQHEALREALERVPDAELDTGLYVDGFDDGFKAGTQRWIPVTERLPEDGENVLVTYKTTDKIHPCQYHDDGSRNPWYSYIDQCRAHMNVVLAWMPLPDPYKEEEDV